MKNFTILYIIFFCLNSVFAQQTNDIGHLAIKVCQPEREGISSSSQQLLESKMNQIITFNGLVDGKCNSRFVFTSKINILNEDILQGLPSRISQILEVTFLIGDVVENKVFNSVILTITGVGLDKNKASINAIKSINVKSEVLRNFIQKTKRMIVNYYQMNCDKILRNTSLLCEQLKYDEAIYQLFQVPDVCDECFVRCQKQIGEIYQQKINTTGEQLLSRAKFTWVQSQNTAGASQAMKLLEQISPIAQCYPLIDSIIGKISLKLQEDEEREWNFMLQEYQDNKEKQQQEFEFKLQQYKDKLANEAKEYSDRKQQEIRDFDFKQQQYKDELAIQKTLIEAAKQIEMEYAKNQPQIVTDKLVRQW